MWQFIGWLSYLIILFILILICFRSIIMSDDKHNGADLVDKAMVEVAQMALETKEEENTKPAPTDDPKDIPTSAVATEEAAGGNGAIKKEENGTPKAAPASNAAFKEQFKAFSKFGDTKSDGKHLTLSQSDKWMKQAKVSIARAGTIQ